MKRINTSDKQINTKMSFGIHHKKLLIQKISILGIAVGGILDLGSKADISMQMVTFEAFFVRIFPLMAVENMDGLLSACLHSAFIL